jgi:NADH-quinone oxidoreductase subunit E
VPDTFKPAMLAAPRDGSGDDLKLIRGVGPKLEALLHSLGIFHFDQIAVWNSDNLRWVDQHLEGFRGRADRDQWIEQARKLATGWRPTNPAGEKAGS